MKKTVMIVAGGTGGHVFPGIAVARTLIAEDVRVVWLGTKQGLDAKLVPQEGIEFYQISMVGLRGKGLLRKLTMPLRLIQTVFQSLQLIRKIKPNTILGMGGYVTAPAGIAAWLLGKRLVIHEQNAIAGMSNHYLAKIANVVLQAFPNTFISSPKVITVGNPVRDAILALPEPTQRFAQRSDYEVPSQDKLRVLILGGSLGAHAINHVMPKVYAELAQKIDIYHQTGQSTYDETVAQYGQLTLSAKITAFIDDMAAAYAWADIVICRAGALTVSELAAAGVASILIPLPSAVDDHQTENAKYLTNNNASILLPQSTLTKEKLQKILQEFITDRKQLLIMAENARRLAMRNAVSSVIKSLFSERR